MVVVVVLEVLVVVVVVVVVVLVVVVLLVVVVDVVVTEVLLKLVALLVVVIVLLVVLVAELDKFKLTLPLRFLSSAILSTSASMLPLYVIFAVIFRRKEASSKLTSLASDSLASTDTLIKCDPFDSNRRSPVSKPKVTPENIPL